MKKSLLLGCGNSREKKLYSADMGKQWPGQLVAVDMNPNCGADLVVELGKWPLPFADEEFDEIGAYDVLEHWGQQGDWRGWFDECAEYWRILKPGGIMGIIVPTGAEAFADPGHTRFFGQNHFWMLNQGWYTERIEANLPVSDYRWYWRRNFNVAVQDVGGHHLGARLTKD